MINIWRQIDTLPKGNEPFLAARSIGTAENMVARCCVVRKSTSVMILSSL